MKKFVIGLLTIVVLTACTGGASAPIQGQWKLVSYGSASGQAPAAPDVDTLLEFKDGQLSGSVGCNHFSGEYEVSGDSITFGPVMATEMFCETVAEQEAGTFATLQNITSFVLDGNTLTITSVDGNSIVLERK